MDYDGEMHPRCALFLCVTNAMGLPQPSPYVPITPGNADQCKVNAFHFMLSLGLLKMKIREF
jgi:hypothetical protein